MSSLRHSAAGWRCQVDDAADKAECYLIGVLAGDAGGYHVTPRAGYAIWILKVNQVVAPWSFSIKHPDVFDSVQWDAHGNLGEKKEETVRVWFSLTSESFNMEHQHTVVYLKLSGW